MAKLILKSPYIKGKRSAGHLRYIATRDGVEKYVSYIDGRPKSQGLFSDAGKSFSLNSAMKEAAAHEGNIWCHIISLRREDADRLNYDNVQAWMNLLRQQRNTIARQMHIKPENFRWYAAFHDEKHHPHVHLMAWSAKPGEAWLNERGIEDIKSALARNIFSNDLMHVYEQQTQHRDALRQDSRAFAAEIVRQINAGSCENLLMQDLLLKLFGRLNNLAGKKQYGYLPVDLKATVDRIVDELAKDERITKLYDLWYEQREAVLMTYCSEMPERVALSENDAFRTIKNAVVAEAAKLNHQEQVQQSDAGDVVLGSMRLLGQLSQMIESKIDDGPKQVQVESKLLQEIAKKKLDSGLRLG